MTWLDRQSFLGDDSGRVLRDSTIGLVGLGGGNSHVVQQLAHVGIGGFVLADDDVITHTNLNRLVGGTVADVEKSTPKVAIAERVIRGVNPAARIIKHQKLWQLVADDLKQCDLIVGAVDQARAKDELDAFCRRFMIPYIDMGMIVRHIAATDEYLIAGQVVLSSPDRPCLRCMGIVTNADLEEEGRRYGDAGDAPQVVWPNGLLASAAVGLVLQILTPWHKAPVDSAYLVYDGNRNTLVASDRLKRLAERACPHYDSSDTGDPTFDIRRAFGPQDSALPEAPLKKRSLWDWLRGR
jgi:molybdopterin/thiamine biosynthesis adenylyltransferase